MADDRISARGSNEEWSGSSNQAKQSRKKKSGSTAILIKERGLFD